MARFNLCRDHVHNHRSLFWLISDSSSELRLCSLIHIYTSNHDCRDNQLTQFNHVASEYSSRCRFGG